MNVSGRNFLSDAIRRFAQNRLALMGLILVSLITRYLNFFFLENKIYFFIINLRINSILSIFFLFISFFIDFIK